MDQVTTPMSAREMHKFVWACVGVMILLAVTTPIAMLRVSQMDKFKGFHVKSMTDTGKVTVKPSPSIKP